MIHDVDAIALLHFLDCTWVECCSQEMRTDLDRQGAMLEGLNHQLEMLRRRDHDLVMQVHMW